MTSPMANDPGYNNPGYSNPAYKSPGFGPPPPPSVEDVLGSWRRWGLILGAAGTVMCAVGAKLSPGYFYPSYLVSFLFWFSLTMGCFVVTMLHWLSGGMWGQVLRRVLMSVLPTVPLFALLSLPIGYGLTYIYPWAQTQDGESSASAAVSGDQSRVLAAYRAPHEEDHELLAKRGYLDVHGFYTRAGVMFILWIVLTALLERWSWGDSPRDESIHRHWGYRLAGPSLLIYSLSTLVMSTDWVMSIQPHWYSAMFGVTMMAIHAINGFAFAILASAYLAQWKPWSAMDKPRHWGDLGSLLFTATMFWTYTAFMQYLIIYAGNLPIESAWFVARNGDGDGEPNSWIWVSRLLILFHFFVPFMCLLMRPIKRNRRLLAYVAGLLIVMDLVECYWLVVPALFPEGFMLNWTAPLAVVAIGGWWVAIVSSRLQGQLARPIYDPEYEKACHAKTEDHADLATVEG